MNPFSTTYASHYDLLYREKDYAAECAFLRQTFARHAARPPASVLDLGCGTGGHAIPLAESGLKVTGVDRAPEMIELARAKAKKAGLTDRIHFAVGDLQSHDAARQFDAVICLFAVVSYLTRTDGVLASLRNMRRQLKPGGVLIFDFWYGPAVLMDPPQDRFKVIDEPGVRVVRHSRPMLDTLTNRVDIEFHLLELRGKEVKSDHTETHELRYFFAPEMENFLEQSGLKLLAWHPSFKEATLTPQDWTAMAVATTA